MDGSGGGEEAAGAGSTAGARYGCGAGEEVTVVAAGADTTKRLYGGGAGRSLVCGWLKKTLPGGTPPLGGCPDAVT